MCCAPVNSCSVTSMTVVHFLHQADIGLALHKHKAIYSISSTLFSRSHSFSLFLSPSLYLSPSHVFAFLLCKQEPGVKCVSCADLVPFLSRASIYLLISPLRSLAPHDSRLLHLTVAFHLPLTFTLSFLTPTPSPHLSLSVFSFTQLFCCRFDRYD